VAAIGAILGSWLGVKHLPAAALRYILAGLLVVGGSWMLIGHPTKNGTFRRFAEVRATSAIEGISEVEYLLPAFRTLSLTLGNLALPTFAS
jgi:uncharacterized membrane protein YfcA